MIGLCKTKLGVFGGLPAFEGRAFGLLAFWGLGLTIPADKTDEFEHVASAGYSCDIHIRRLGSKTQVVQSGR